MLKDIANNKFIEYGQHDSCYYGTKYDSIRDCIRSGRMCILDISPQVSETNLCTACKLRTTNLYGCSRMLFYTADVLPTRITRR